jgi:hypothetical protein
MAVSSDAVLLLYMLSAVTWTLTTDMTCTEKDVLTHDSFARASSRIKEPHASCKCVRGV